MVVELDEDGRSCVTQGTIFNRDFDQLVRPTLDALADHDVLVVRDRRPAAGRLGVLPPNARGAELLVLRPALPKTDVFVTNAGYGGAQYALSHGVPIVAAGRARTSRSLDARQWAGSESTCARERRRREACVPA